MIKIGQIGIGHNHFNKITTIQKHPELFHPVGNAEDNEEWVDRRAEPPYLKDLPRMSEAEVIVKSDAILDYDNAVARVFSSSVEWDGWARRSFAVTGELGKVHIQPMEEPCQMTFVPRHEKKRCGVQMAQPVEFPNDPSKDRYVDILLGFYDYITHNKENPFDYEHEYAVQEVLCEAVGGVKILGTELEES